MTTSWPAGSLHVFGSELSPYSMKLRSFLRYKGISHVWTIRTAENYEEFARRAKTPLMPLVIYPDGHAEQDSTPIMEAIELARPDPACQPSEPTAAFIALLLEEFGDEWLNKLLAHYRWNYDCAYSLERVVRMRAPDLTGAPLAAAIRTLEQERVPKILEVAGATPANAPTFEDSLRGIANLLDRHLESRSYLFGGRPCLADFSLSAQLYQCAQDPTAGDLLRTWGVDHFLAWCDRMLDPAPSSDFDPYSSLAPTLDPLLREEVAGRFLPWASANSRAVAGALAKFTVTLNGRPFLQRAQRYPAKSFAALRQKLRAFPDPARLHSLLAQTGCSTWLEDG